MPFNPMTQDRRAEIWQRFGENVNRSTSAAAESIATGIVKAQEQAKELKGLQKMMVDVLKEDPEKVDKMTREEALAHMKGLALKQASEEHQAKMKTYGDASAKAAREQTLFEQGQAADKRFREGIGRLNQETPLDLAPDDPAWQDENAPITRKRTIVEQMQGLAELGMASGKWDANDASRYVAQMLDMAQKSEAMNAGGIPERDPREMKVKGGTLYWLPQSKDLRFIPDEQTPWLAPGQTYTFPGDPEKGLNTMAAYGMGGKRVATQEAMPTGISQKTHDYFLENTNTLNQMRVRMKALKAEKAKGSSTAGEELDKLETAHKADMERSMQLLDMHRENMTPKQYATYYKLITDQEAPAAPGAGKAGDPSLAVDEAFKRRQMMQRLGAR